MQALSETKEKIEKNKGKGDLRDLRAGRGDISGWLEIIAKRPAERPV